MSEALRTFNAIPANFRTTDNTDGDWPRAPQWKAATDAGESAAIGLASAHTRMREGMGQFVSLLKMEPRTKTPEGHYLETNDAAQSWLKATATITQNARDAADRRLAALDGEIAAKMRCTDDGNTPKLRDRIYAMKPADREALITKAIEAGDRTRMAAILNGDALLCGLTDKEQEAFRNFAMQKHAGEEMKMKNNIAFARQKVFDTFTDVIIAMGTLFPAERVAALKNETAAIAAARSRLLA